MKRKKNMLWGMVILTLLATACNRRANYECQCYKEGVPSTNYEIGRIDGKLVDARCEAIMQQNGEDDCDVAMLK